MSCKPNKKVMQVAVLRERKVRERRVALSPDAARALIKKGYQIKLERGAGEGSSFLDSMYEGVGVHLVDFSEAITADLVLKVNAPSLDELMQMIDGATFIGFLYAYTQPELIKAMKAKAITSFAMDAVPRISRAQSMDALSSQANLAGYKAVLLGAHHMGIIFPLLMTAAGTIKPARVLIFGAGVAGLQAIATAKRLGAVVEVTDVRPETKEQVESLGGRFLVVEGAEGVSVEGGYAKEVSADFLERQKKLVEERIKEADLVITTALVIGKKAPILVNEAMVLSMKPGSVIVDMAVESGGNCALSEIDQVKQVGGVTIVGLANLPSHLSTNASQLYGANIATFLQHISTPTELKIQLDDEICRGSLITHQGALVHEFTKSILQQ